MPLQAAVDVFGNAWFSVVDPGVAILENVPYESNTETFYGYAYNDPTGGAADGYQIALDAAGDVYVSDHAEGRIYKVDPSGLMAASGFNDNSTGSCCGLTNVALEDNGDYVTIQNGDVLTQSDPNGNQIVYTGLDTGMPAGALDNPGALAVDSSAAIWAINADNVLSKFAGGSGSPDQGPGFTGGGLNSNTTAWPYVWLAIDGAGTVWVPNYAGQSLSEFNNAGTAITGVTGIVGPTAGCAQKGLAVDMGGNVWVTCDSETAPVMEFLGLATPVYAPLYPGKLGAKP
jgi:streptogramin lyase